MSHDDQANEPADVEPTIADLRAENERLRAHLTSATDLLSNLVELVEAYVEGVGTVDLPKVLSRVRNAMRAQAAVLGRDMSHIDEQSERLEAIRRRNAQACKPEPVAPAVLVQLSPSNPTGCLWHAFEDYDDAMMFARRPEHVVQTIGIGDWVWYSSLAPEPVAPKPEPTPPAAIVEATNRPTPLDMADEIARRLESEQATGTNAEPSP